MRCRTSPLTVEYKDLLNMACKVLSEKEIALRSARGRGVRHLNPLIHDVEVAGTLVRMLKKGLPGKQTDFANLFEQVK